MVTSPEEVASWTDQQVQAELTARNLPTTGSADTVRERLYLSMRFPPSADETSSVALITVADASRAIHNALQRNGLGDAASGIASGVQNTGNNNAAVGTAPGTEANRGNSSREGCDSGNIASGQMPLHASSPHGQVATRYHAPGMTAYDIMHKWNVRFSGVVGEPVDGFLTLIEDGRALVSITDEDLLNCLPLFLGGLAYHWYKVERSHFATWRACSEAMRRRFGNPEFQESLREEIHDRTQGAAEPVSDYFTCMRNLFIRVDIYYRDCRSRSDARISILSTGSNCWRALWNEVTDRSRRIMSREPVNRRCFPSSRTIHGIINDRDRVREREQWWRAM